VKNSLRLTADVEFHGEQDAVDRDRYGVEKPPLLSEKRTGADGLIYESAGY
jgi:hypothetical protein